MFDYKIDSIINAQKCFLPLSITNKLNLYIYIYLYYLFEY